MKDLLIVAYGIGGLALVALLFAINPLLGIVGVLGFFGGLGGMNAAGWFRPGPDEPTNRM